MLRGSFTQTQMLLKKSERVDSIDLTIPCEQNERVACVEIKISRAHEIEIQLATARAASARTLLSTSGRRAFAPAFVGALAATKC